MPATQSDVHPDSAKILADLPLRPRADLYVESRPDARGNFLVMEERADDVGCTALIGLAISEEGGWYLGCIECRDEISEFDAGMCRRCREDAAEQEQVYAGEEE